MQGGQGDFTRPILRALDSMAGAEFVPPGFRGRLGAAIAEFDQVAAWLNLTRPPATLSHPMEERKTTAPPVECLSQSLGSHELESRMRENRLSGLSGGRWSHPFSIHICTAATFLTGTIKSLSCILRKTGFKKFHRPLRELGLTGSLVPRSPVQPSPLRSQPLLPATDLGPGQPENR